MSQVDFTATDIFDSGICDFSCVEPIRYGGCHLHRKNQPEFRKKKKKFFVFNPTFLLTREHISRTHIFVPRKSLHLLSKIGVKMCRNGKLGGLALEKHNATHSRKVPEKAM